MNAELSQARLAHWQVTDALWMKALLEARRHYCGLQSQREGEPCTVTRKAVLRTETVSHIFC